MQVSDYRQIEHLARQTATAIRQFFVKWSVHSNVYSLVKRSVGIPENGPYGLLR